MFFFARRIVIALLIAGSLFVATSQETLHAQPESEARGAFGIYGNIAFVNHTADFRAIPGFPNCCPIFTNGTGTGVDLGLAYKLPISNSFLFYLRAGYSSYGATLSDREGTTVLDSNGSPTSGAFDHSVTASLGSIGIEPMVGLAILPRLVVRAGARVGYVITKTFSQKEVIAEPASFGVFTDTRTRSRNVFNDQPLPNASTIEAALLVGLSYELPLNASGTLHAVPEAYYSRGLTEITKDLTWKSNAIRVGIGIEYSPLPTAPASPSSLTPQQPAPPKKQTDTHGVE